jgi:hypothetical protein
MKFICVVLLLFSAGYTSAQTEKPGDPIVNFVNKGELTVKDYQLSSNYYTLKNNLSNRSSKAYVADQPTLAQITAAALRMPSEMYKVSKKGVELNMVLFVAGSDNTFLVVEPLAKLQTAFKSDLAGVITENRAKELIKEKYDPAAIIKGGQLTFNKGQYLIIPDAQIKAALIALIEKEGLSNEGPAGSSLTYAQIHQQIISGSKEGGKLDFFTPIKGREYDEKQLKPDMIVTTISAALYEWGKANAALGVKSIQDALAYFSEVNARSLSNREIEFITMGFEEGSVKKGDDANQ